MPIIASILFSITAVVAGQILIKKGLNSLGVIDFEFGLVSAYLKIFLCPLVLLGILLYAIGVFAWLYVLSKVDLSYAYPFMGLTFILVAFFSSVFLGESISMARWIGILAISLGVVLVASS